MNRRWFSKSPELLKLAETAVAQGWTVAMTGGSHVRFTSPEGRVVHTGSTPSCPRSVLNCRSLLRRYGLRI